MDLAPKEYGAPGRGQITDGPTRAQSTAFVADEVKKSALDHVNVYRRLFKYNGEDQTSQRKIIQGQAATDLQRLLSETKQLESLLRRWRILRWLANGTLAAAWHVVMINYIPFWRHDSPYKNHKLNNSYLTTMIYLLSLPLFGASLLNHEKKISCTVAVGEGLEDLYHLIRKGAALDDGDVEVLTDTRWDVVPWFMVEDYG